MFPRFQPKHVLAIAGLFIVAVQASAASLPVRKPETLFRPFRGEGATLSRDGNRLAYVAVHRSRWHVMLLDLAKGGARQAMALEDSAAAKPVFMAWTSAGMLAVAFDSGSVYAIDAAAPAAAKVLDERLFSTVADVVIHARKPRVVGVVPDAPDTLLVEGVAPRHDTLDDVFDAYGFVQYAEETEEMQDALAKNQTAPLSHEMMVARLPDSERRQMALTAVRLDLRTGKWKIASTLTDSRRSQVLYDRQGRPRIQYVRATDRQTFVHLASRSGAGPRRQELDTWLGRTADLGFHITPQNFLGQRSFPVAFDADPAVLYFASNVGRDTFALCALDLREKTWREIATGAEGRDLFDVTVDDAFSTSPLIFDRARDGLVGVHAEGAETLWLDAELREMQATIARKFPRRNVRIVDWDDARARFLVLVETDADPGRWFVFHREDGRVAEVLRRAPWLDAEQANAAMPFAFEVNGTRLEGRVTLPHVSLVLPPPLVVVFHDGPWQRTRPGFDREAQALADLGCIVLQIDYRGSSGRGWKHLHALREGFDRVPIEDALAAMDWLARERKFDPKRVAAYGEGYGGYLALRATQLAPERFRCAISVNGAIDPRQLQEMSREKRDAEREHFQTILASYNTRQAAAIADGAPPELLPLEESPGEIDFRLEVYRDFFRRDANNQRAIAVPDGGPIKQSLLLLHDPDNPIVSISPVASFARQMRRQGGDAELVEISPAFARGSLEARAATFQRIGEFLHEKLYDYDVKIGELKEVK